MIGEKAMAGLGGKGVIFYFLVVVNTFYNYLLSCAHALVLKFFQDRHPVSLYQQTQQYYTLFRPGSHFLSLR